MYIFFGFVGGVLAKTLLGLSFWESSIKCAVFSLLS